MRASRWSLAGLAACVLAAPALVGAATLEQCVSFVSLFDLDDVPDELQKTVTRCITGQEDCCSVINLAFSYGPLGGCFCHEDFPAALLDSVGFPPLFGSVLEKRVFACDVPRPEEPGCVGRTGPGPWNAARDDDARAVSWTSPGPLGKTFQLRWRGFLPFSGNGQTRIGFGLRPKRTDGLDDALRALPRGSWMARTRSTWAAARSAAVRRWTGWRVGMLGRVRRDYAPIVDVCRSTWLGKFTVALVETN
ncbi:unnamed protein product [Pedinophyceae sp. YPF-701]|nr:unnamed protein product [Pedinophyceae sp. YPF-701]